LPTSGGVGIVRLLTKSHGGFFLYNLNCTPTTLGYKVEDKLHLEVREQKKKSRIPLIWKNTRVQVMLIYISSLTYFCGIVISCGEKII
jgi:hypothetical protein